MIEIRDVSYHYHARGGVIEVLHKLSLSIAAGEHVALIGPSGCGKTTLLHLLASLRPLQTGTISINGREAHAIIENNLYSIIFQDPALLDWLTVEQNVTLPVRLNPALHYIPAAEMLRQVGLYEYRQLYPHQLSGGMKTRVGLARALMAQTPVLLMDECFANLDEVTREDMNLFLLAILRQLPRTLVFITHSLTEAVFIADRVIVFSRKPAQIIGDVRIALPRPRALEDIDNPAYTAYRKTIRCMLNH